MKHTTTSIPLSHTIAELTEYGKFWRDANEAAKRLTLQGLAICRRFSIEPGMDLDDAKTRAKLVKKAAALHKSIVDGECDNHGLTSLVMAFEGARAPFVERQTEIEKILATAAERLPAYHAMKDRGLKGISPKWFGLIVGAAGDIGAFPRHDLLWKRFGLAVIDGERQRKCANAEKAALHGYAPQRRSLMWVVGNGLIGGMGNGPRPFAGEDVEQRDDLTSYQKLFVRKLRYEAEKDPKQRLPDTAEGKESYTRAAAARAKRYVEKKFLRDLWATWRHCEPMAAEIDLKAAA